MQLAAFGILFNWAIFVFMVRLIPNCNVYSLSWIKISKGRTIRKDMVGGGGGGKFSSRRNFFFRNQILCKNFLGHRMNIL